MAKLFHHLKPLTLFFVLLSLSACPFCGGEDRPFTFAQEEDVIEGPGGSEIPNLCQEVVCDEGFECNIETGACEKIAPVVCESDADCEEDFICNPTNGECIEQGETVCPDTVCPVGEVAVPPSCSCQQTFPLKFNAVMRLLIDHWNDKQDIPNQCEEASEAQNGLDNPDTDEFQCPMDMTRLESLPLSRPMPLGSPLYDVNYGRYMLDDYAPVNGFADRGDWGQYMIDQFERSCNMLDASSGSRDKCLHRECPSWYRNSTDIACNTPMTPYAAWFNQPILLNLTPPVDGKGYVVMTREGFPQYGIFGTSPQLVGYLVIDGGAGGLLDGTSFSMPTETFYGTYTVENQGTAAETIHFNLNYRFRVQATSMPCPAAICGERVERFPQPNNPNVPDSQVLGDDALLDVFKVLSASPGIPGSIDMGDSTDIVPAVGTSPLLLSTGEVVADPGTTDCFGAPLVDVGPIRGSGIPLHYTDDGRAKMRLATGVKIHGKLEECGTRNLVLGTALDNAVLFVELDGFVTNADDSDFRGIAFAERFTGAEEGLNLRVLHTEKENVELVQTDVGDTREVTMSMARNPYYIISSVMMDATGALKEPFVTLQAQGRFETTEHLTIRNESRAAIFNIEGYSLTPVDGAFSLVTLPPAELEAGQELTVGFVYRPGENVNGCENDASDGVFRCRATLTLGDLVIHLVGSGKIAGGALKVTELAWQEVENFGLPIRGIFPNSDPSDPKGHEIDFGKVGSGAALAKLFRISNSGVLDITYNGYSILQPDPFANPFRIFSVLRKNSSGFFVPTGSGATITPTGEGDLYLYIYYVPSSTFDGDLEQGKLVLRYDLDLSDGLGVGISNSEIPLKGTVDADTGGIIQIYLEDPEQGERETAGLFITPDLLGPDGENLFLAGTYSGPDAIDALASFRASGAPRAVYLVNGRPGGENIVIDRIPADFDEATFSFVRESGVEGTELTPCPARGTGDPRCRENVESAWAVKIGTATFKPTGPETHYVVLSRDISLDVLVRGSTQEYGVRFVGARNAPTGNALTLHVNRMFAGMKNGLVNDNYINLLASTVTPAQVAAEFGGLDASVEHWINRYKLTADFNAAAGFIKIHPLFTPPQVDGNFDNPTGISLFNIPGSGGLGAAGTSPYLYGFKCHEALLEADRTGRPAPICSFLYAYLADGAVVGTSSAATPIFGGYTGNNPLHPTIPTPGMTSASFFGDVERAKLKGIYDPATGEMSFPRAGIRLYTPGANAQDADGNLLAVDTVLTGPLTTKCIDEGMMGDGVDANDLDLLNPRLKVIDLDPATDIGSTSYGANPVTPYVAGFDSTHPTYGCETGFYHGRPLYAPGANLPADQEDYTGTLDNRPGHVESLPTNPNFDLSGVMTSRSSVSLGHQLTMYMTFKLCVSGTSNFPASACE